MSELTYCVDLGRLAYRPALSLQHRVVAARQAGRLPDVLLLVEHDPVITLGQRGKAEHILASAEALAQAGIEVQRVDRGGDVTYHGPGQLVGYPIFHLQERGLGAADYMHRLEEVLIAVLADFGLSGRRREGLIGVWLGHDKVAALGARIARGVSYHGFALNISTNLSHFGLIIPCGITQGGVTSMEKALSTPVAWPQVQAAVQEHIAHLFRTRLQALALEELERLLLS